MSDDATIGTVASFLQAFDADGQLHVRGKVHITPANWEAVSALKRCARKHFGGPLTRQRLQKLIARVSKVHRMSYVRILRLSLADFWDRLLVSARDAAKLRLTQAVSATGDKSSVSPEPTPTNRQGRRKGRAGRKPDPKIAKRNQKIIAAFKAGQSVNQVCERFHVTAGNARRIKSEARLSKPKQAKRRES